MKEDDDLYKMTITQDDYVNPIVDRTLSWCYVSSYTSDLDEGMEN